MTTKTDDLKLQALLAEYERVKEEIFHHKTTQQTVINFIIILLAAELSFFSTLQSTNVIWLLIAPIPFSLLSIYHTGYTIRIHKLATFLDNDARKKIEKIVGENILRTKSYYPTTNVFQLHKSSFDGRLTYIALMGLKALPQLLPIIAYFSSQKSPSSFLEYFFLILDVIMLLFSTLGQHD